VVLQCRLPAAALANAQLLRVLSVQRGADQGAALLALQAGQALNAACQTAHWSLHKKECVAPMASRK
jgi:hypothetical protein